MIKLCPVEFFIRLKNQNNLTGINRIKNIDSSTLPIMVCWNYMTYIQDILQL